MNNKFINLALVLFACVALANCSGYGAGPAVQQVNLASLPGPIAQYLDGPAAHGPSSGYGPAAHGPSSGYGPAAHAPATQYAPATSIVVPAAPIAPAAGAYNAAPAAAAPSAGYAAGPSAGYGAPAAPSAGYAAAPSAGYGAPAAPRYSVQNAWAAQLYPGQNNYKSYQSPPQFSRVALPIVPSSPVAKLWVPNQPSHAHHEGAYGHGGSARAY